jgi:glutamate carboxypeptidase
VVISGRAAHAGLEPEQGRNTLVEAAHQVLRIDALDDAAAGTTVTPTVARVGTADNVIPAEAVIRVDTRVASAAEKERVEAALGALTAVGPDITIEVSGAITRPPMPESASEALFHLAEAAVPGIGGVAVGGGSDGNFTAAIGVPTLDGLGAVGGGAHADHEFVVVDTMPGRVDLIDGILRRILAGPQ